jgi:hypothetical protein
MALDPDTYLSTPAAYASPQQLQEARDFASRLQPKGNQMLHSPSQGYAQIVAAITSGLIDQEANRTEQLGNVAAAIKQGQASGLPGGDGGEGGTASLLPGMGGDTSVPGTAGQTPRGLDPSAFQMGSGAVPLTVDQIKYSISQNESNGRYDLDGPMILHGHYQGDHAIGKYQVMQSDLPEKLRDAGLPPMTPAQFKANHQAQELQFEHEFINGYMKKYGNFNDAASVWFSGRPFQQAGNASDGYMTVPAYVAKANRSLGQWQLQNQRPGSPAGAFPPVNQTPPAPTAVAPPAALFGGRQTMSDVPPPGGPGAQLAMNQARPPGAVAPSIMPARPGIAPPTPSPSGGIPAALSAPMGSPSPTPTTGPGAQPFAPPSGGYRAVSAPPSGVATAPNGTQYQPPNFQRPPIDVRDMFPNMTRQQYISVMSDPYVDPKFKEDLNARFQPKTIEMPDGSGRWYYPGPGRQPTFTPGLGKESPGEAGGVKFPTFSRVDPVTGRPITDAPLMGFSSGVNGPVGGAGINQPGQPSGGGTIFDSPMMTAAQDYAAAGKQKDTTATENAKAYAGFHKGLQGVGYTAAQMQPLVDIAKGIVDDKQFYSGTGAQAIEYLRRAGVATGFLPKDAATPMEAFNKVIAAAIQQQILDLKAQEETMGEKGGRVFKQQLDLMQAAAANLDNTVAGNRFLVKFFDWAGKRAMRVSDLADDYASEHGNTLDANFEKGLRHAMTSDPELTLPKDFQFPNPPAAQEPRRTMGVGESRTTNRGVKIERLQ